MLRKRCASCGRRGWFGWRRSDEGNPTCADSLACVIRIARREYAKMQARKAGA